LDTIRANAEEGKAEYQYILAVLYDNGDGVEQNKYLAFKWYKKSAENGYTKAQHNLAYCYSRGEGTPVDHESACHWYEKAARNGYVSSQINLANELLKGKGIRQDFKKAYVWYSVALEFGDKAQKSNARQSRDYAGVKLSVDQRYQARSEIDRIKARIKKQSKLKN